MGHPLGNLGVLILAAAVSPVTPSTAGLEPEPPPALAQRSDSVIERTFNVTPGGLLTLDLKAGGGVTVRGWDEDRVRVRALLRGLNWRDLDVRIERESNGVRVDARFAGHRDNYFTSHHFEIMVPRRYDVRLTSSGGALTLTGLEGRLTGTTGGGDILVRDSDLSGSVSTGGGTVRISNVRGGLRGSSGSGPVIYGEPTDSSTTGTLHITKDGGDVHLEAAPNGAVVTTGGGNVSIGRSSGRVEAGTGVGNVTVGPVAGSVRAGTGAGDVRIIVDRGRGDDQVIEAISGFGRVIVELPSDFDGRLDLEAAYTRSREDSARITSDWHLDRDPLTDWEIRYGMPRRILRARAVLGSGNARVTVRALNGEIEIRRR